MLKLVNSFNVILFSQSVVVKLQHQYYFPKDNLEIIHTSNIDFISLLSFFISLFHLVSVYNLATCRNVYQSITNRLCMYHNYK